MPLRGFAHRSGRGGDCGPTFCCVQRRIDGTVELDLGPLALRVHSRQPRVQPLVLRCNEGRSVAQRRELVTQRHIRWVLQVQHLVGVLALKPLVVVAGCRQLDAQRGNFRLRPLCARLGGTKRGLHLMHESLHVRAAAGAILSRAHLILQTRHSRLRNGRASCLGPLCSHCPRCRFLCAAEFVPQCGSPHGLVAQRFLQ
jgi:hypothetical protein